MHKPRKRFVLSILLANFILLLSLNGGTVAVSGARGLRERHRQLITVPGDARTIQEGIDRAEDGDLVLVLPGVYHENLVLSGKSITLASQFLTTRDPTFIRQTVLDGGGRTVITADSSAGPETKIIGFTIQNGDDGISPAASLSILNNRFTGNNDAIDYQGGGGLCRENVFENNKDDGIDLDGPVDVTIEENLIRDNSDDGIEARLQEYQGETLHIVIRDNTISGNGEDGIQLIDYPDVSDRVFLIEKNLIAENAKVGLGLMEDGHTRENEQGARIPEPIHLFNNTFVKNPYAVTGGGNLIALNNLFVRSDQVALKNVGSDSIAAYNLFWDNKVDQEASNLDTSTNLFVDPLLREDYYLQAGSPAIDRGAAHFEWKGEAVLDFPPGAYTGAAPDLGRYQTPVVGFARAVEPNLDPLTFSAVADAMVKESDPDANFGKRAVLKVDGGGHSDEESYLRFQVTGLSRPVVRAKLRLFATSKSASGPTVYSTGNDWSEQGLTWNTRQTRTSGAVVARGVIAPDSWVEYDVTSLVSGNGLASFVLATNSSDGISFSSREGSMPPQLVLEFTETAVEASFPVLQPGQDPVLVGAGDIASCDSTGDEATADLLDRIAGTVFTAGDNAYLSGSMAKFNTCYEPSWGRHRVRTRPSPGNHDYNTPGAAGYFEYFGGAAGDPSKGYYSYDLGAWHIIALNSNIPASAGSAQERWLRADLASHPTTCTLAYWHHPRFSSGLHGSSDAVQALWQALYDYGADVVLNGHDHDYERFAPQDPNGRADPQHGIREFVVGTGGDSLYPFFLHIANSEVRNANSFGVLKLTLHPTSYDWEFIPVAGKSFTDSGSADCVTSASAPAPQGGLPRGVNTSLLAAGPHLIPPALVENAVPITNPQPPSTLLPPGTTNLNLSVQSTSVTSCAYALGDDEPFEQMAPFDLGEGTTFHETLINGLSPDPNIVNTVFVRCASQPDYVLKLKYRSLPQADPAYPRAGNLWGWWDLHAKGLPYMSHIDLWLGASHAAVEDIRALRRLNPNMLILADINTVDAGDGLPDDYYLKDVNGDRLEVWPNSFRLNLTRPEVAEYKAQEAYQQMLDKDLMFDGMFFDNFFTTQSWAKSDYRGKRFQIDANGDGVEDDPAALDAAWKAGVMHEMETFRALMPNAILSGHAMNIEEPGIAEFFNGISFTRKTADVLEGQMLFADLWNEYNAWQEMAWDPQVIMFESSPPDQIAYGYDYSPWEKIPASTLEFARTYYPYVRFGLALTLMGDGYFAHEFGDTWHGNDWWYDELDYNLGYPLGPAERVDLGVPPGENLLVNGGFESETNAPWHLQVNETEGAAATLTRDTTDKVAGAASARVDVTATAGKAWQIALSQNDGSLEKGVIYDVTFWAKSDTARNITVSARKAGSVQDNYGLRRKVSIGPEWKPYAFSFAASATAGDAQISFLFGEAAGTVWLDDIRLSERPPDVYRRKFTNGMVLLNGTQETQEIYIGPGYRRLQGQQAPRYEYILDDAGVDFSATGSWATVTYDSGELQATGPFYHCWKTTCHERSGSQGEARWDLQIPAADTYTLTAWWPAAPQASTWSQKVTFEVVSGGQVVAAKTLDQTSGGDEWHFLAEVYLPPDKENYVRMYCEGEAPCVADALHITSAARYNDGSVAQSVTLGPLDGIILARSKGMEVFLPLMSWK